MKVILGPTGTKTKGHICTEAVVGAVQKDLSDRFLEEYSKKDYSYPLLDFGGMYLLLDFGGMCLLTEPEVIFKSGNERIQIWASQVDIFKERLTKALLDIREYVGVKYVKVHGCYFCLCCTPEEAKKYLEGFEWF